MSVAGQLVEEEEEEEDEDGAAGRAAGRLKRSDLTTRAHLQLAGPEVTDPRWPDGEHANKRQEG